MEGVELIGATLSHHRILEKLGEGGMGVVYKAQDLELDRIVALKFLSHHLKTDEVEQARFLQEARAASALNHPNVCNIHSIGEHGDQRFIDMEFVEGHTLRTSVAGGRLKPDDALRYAIQIGEALQEAHSKGIVHPARSFAEASQGDSDEGGDTLTASQERGAIRWNCERLSCADAGAPVS